MQSVTELTGECLSCDEPIPAGEFLCSECKPKSPNPTVIGSDYQDENEDG